MKPLLGLIALALLLNATSIFVFKNNPYMRYNDVSVTFIDRYATQSCHKSSCREVFVGVYKTESGTVFEERISGYSYRQMHLGEKFTLNIRQFDIHQTSKENLFLFLAPVILYSITLTAWFAVLVSLYSILTYKERS